MSDAKPTHQSDPTEAAPATAAGPSDGAAAARRKPPPPRATRSARPPPPKARRPPPAVRSQPAPEVEGVASNDHEVAALAASNPMPSIPVPAEELAPPEGSPALTDGVAASTDAESEVDDVLDAPIPAGETSRRSEAARATVRACEEELQRGAEPARAARLHYEMGRLLEAPLWDFSAAAEHYEAARLGWPDHVPTLRGLRRVLTALGRYTAIPALIDAEVRNTKESTRRAQLLYEKGCAYRDYLEDHKEARSAFAAAVELDPSHLSLLKAVRLSELAAGGWVNLDKAYERTAAALVDDERQRAATLVARAQLAADQGRDAALAAALHESALEVDGDVPSAVYDLEKLLYANKRWLSLVEVLVRDADRTEDQEVQALTLYQAALIQSDRLGDVDAALPLLERAHSASPDDLTLLHQLVRHYELAGQWPSLVSSLERVAEATASQSERVERLHQLGKIYAAKLDNPELAVQRQRDALALDATFEPAIRALDAMYREQEAWPSLAEVYRAESEADVSTERRTAALMQVAQITEERLGDSEQACTHYQSVLALSPDSAPAFKALVRLYHEAKDFSRLAELYRREIDRVSDAETKRTYLFKLGRLQEDDLAAPERAVVAYRQVLDIEPDNVEALHAVQRAAERAGLWSELAASLEAEAGLARDPASQVALYQRIGEVFELELEDSAGALQWYGKVIARDDCYLPTLRSLARLYSQTGRWEELIAIHKLELKVLPKPDAKAALLYQMGGIAEERLGDEDDAIAHYRKAIQFDGTHRPSLLAVERLLTRHEKWKELVRVVQMELAGSDEPVAQARIQYRVGEIYEHRLGASDLALAAYDAAVSLAADFVPALQARSRLLEQAGDYERLAEDLKRVATAAPGLRRRVDALTRLAQVLHGPLKSPGRAARIYEKILELDASQVGALLSLEHIYSSLGKFEDLARTYERQAKVSTRAEAKVSALRELARVQETQRLVDTSDVAKTHLSIVKLAPGDGSVLTALERLAITRRDWELVSQVDEQLAACSDDPAVVAAYQTRLAEALEERGDAGALDTYRLALSQDPNAIGAARGLVRLARASGNADLLAEAAEYEARVGRDAAGAADLLSLAAKKRASAELSARDLERALDLSPEHVGAARQLIELLRGERRFEPLVQALDHAAQSAKSPERRSDLRVEIAKIQVQELRDAGAAIASAQRAVKECPGHARALLTLANLNSGVRQWREAVRWLRKALEARPAPELEVWAKLELSRILSEHLGGVGEGIEILETLLATDPKNRDALRQLVRAQAAAGQLSPAAKTAGRWVEACESPEERADAHLQLAKLEAARGQATAALHGYQQSVALVGLSGPAASDFKSYLLNRAPDGGTGEWKLYAEALAQFLGSRSIGAPGLGAVHLELSRVQGDQLADANAALMTLRQGIAATEDNAVLRLEMAQRLRRAGQHERAAGEYLLLLGQSSLQPVYWRELSQTYKELGRDEQSRLALGPLVALNQANQLEQATYGMRPPRPEAAGAGRFDKTAFRAVEAHAPDDRATTEILSTLAAGAHKLFPPDLSAYGVNTRDRIGPRSSHAMRTFAERVAAVFGVEDFDVYLHGAPRRRIDVETTETPAIMVPRQVASLAEPLQVFLFARIFSSIARKTYVAERLPVPQLRQMLAGAVRNVDDNHAVDFMDGSALAAEGRRVVKAMPWRVRKPMEEAARAYAAGSQTPLVDWRYRERITAVRAATVVCDDMAGAAALAMQVPLDLSADETAATVSEGLLASVLGFAVSDAAMQLRRRLNLVMK